MRLPRLATHGLRFAITGSRYVLKKKLQLFTDLSVVSLPQAVPKLNDYIQPIKLPQHASKYLTDKTFAAIPVHRPFKDSLRGYDAEPWMRQPVGPDADHA